MGLTKGEGDSRGEKLVGGRGPDLGREATPSGKTVQE